MKGNKLVRTTLSYCRFSPSFPPFLYRRCGGKIHMRDRAWESARIEFLKAFKAFEEAGNGESQNCVLLS